LTRQQKQNETIRYRLA